MTRHRHKRRAYSRFARLMRQRMARMFEPRISDWDLDRPRLGLSEGDVRARRRGLVLILATGGGSYKGAPATGGTVQARDQESES